MYLKKLLPPSWNRFLPLSWISRCLLCGKPEITGPFCIQCLQLFSPKTNRSFCPLCGRPYLVSSQHVCAECRLAPPPWEKFGFAVFFTGIFKEIIANFKFGNCFYYLDFLVGLLECGFWEAKLDLPEVIVSVPMSKKEIQKRGFNQSLELAKLLGKHLNVHVSKQGLSKIKETQPQRQLSRQERLKNVKNVFVCKNGLRNKKVLLIDDVLTTGATCKECARVLKQNKCTVQVLVLARAVE